MWGILDKYLEFKWTDQLKSINEIYQEMDGMRNSLTESCTTLLRKSEW